MNEVLLVYLWGIYPKVAGLIGVSSFVLFVVSIIAFIVSAVTRGDIKEIGRWYTQEDKDRDLSIVGTAYKIGKVTGIIAIVLLIIHTFIPSRNVAVAMYSAPIIVKTATDVNASAHLTKTLENTLEFLERKSAELIKEDK